MHVIVKSKVYSSFVHTNDDTIPYWKSQRPTKSATIIAKAVAIDRSVHLEAVSIVEDTNVVHLALEGNIKHVSETNAKSVTTSHDIWFLLLFVAS